MKPDSYNKNRLRQSDQPFARLQAPPQTYQRATQLPKLLPLWPREIEDTSDEARMRIIGKLRQALWAERRRGRTGLWTYDLNRHLALLDALAGETSQLGKPIASI